MIGRAAFLEIRGTVSEVRGLALRVADLPVPVGAMVRIDSNRGTGPRIAGEVVAFDKDVTIVMPMGTTAGVRRGDGVTAEQNSAFVRVGRSLLGRVLDGMGRPIDNKGPLLDTVPRPLHPGPVDPMDRPLIDQPLATGVRAIDSLLSVGLGQRLGVFAAPGVGKSTLLGSMARHTSADVSVIALVGERGREVRDFIDAQLGPEGQLNSVVVCATGDEPALLRIRAALVANTVAEYFRDQGLNVLLIMDSVTRFCQAQRQIGLSTGEPPATKGYPPSVFSTLPTLLERAGRTRKGSITGFYAVLVEGDDMNEPIADAARGILDGHIVLSRTLASRGHWPAIDVLESISRVVDGVTSVEQQVARREVLRLLASYRQVEDLLNIGAYPDGSNPDFDLAIACKPAIDRLLQQGRSEVQGKADFERTKRQLLALMQAVQSARAQLPKAAPRRGPAPPPAARR
ncbi:MAG: FliI/YscN family ATPase [Planctomycetota bacterium]|nr:FliI/YscN family ATPase [Planctomycetota bacterium]